MGVDEAVKIIRKSHRFVKGQIIEHFRETDSLKDLKKAAKAEGAKDIVNLIEQKQ